jgi:hypothetical protein
MTYDTDSSELDCMVRPLKFRNPKPPKAGALRFDRKGNKRKRKRKRKR